MNEQPVAIVTGSGSGIGRATAIALGARGFAVVLVGRRREPLEVTAELVEGESLLLVANVGCEKGARGIVRGAFEAFGRLDAIINNAADLVCKPFADCGWEELETLYRINAIGPMIVIAEAWKGLAAQHETDGTLARIINISSMATVDPFPGLGAYAASKAAVNLLTKACANEGEAAGIKAFAVAPGAVETEMLRGFVNEAQLPKSMTLAPEEVAAVVVACAAGERDAENGSVIQVPSPE